MTQGQKTLYYDILDSHVLADDIQALLRKYKEDNRDLIRLGGTKEEKIENLFEAIENNIIELSEVQGLLKDAEEYGDQYIYFYKPVDGVNPDQYHDGDKIANAILPQNIRKDFPKIIQMPSKREWVDFRAPNRGVKNSWMFKLYDRKTREVKENEARDVSGRRVVTYVTKEDRLVYIALWDGEDELSLKISRTSFDSTKSLRSSRIELEQMMARGIHIRKDFKFFDLTDTINKILINSEDNKNNYILLSAKLKDTHNGYATISSHGEDETDLLSDVSRKEAINAYINGNGKASSLVVQFLAEGSNGELSKDIKVVLGKHTMNEIIISSKISPQEYKYVRRKIAEFS
ncbi:hypothetical protein SAMN05660776_1356 [Salegentibacter holothuriorum]|uniref:Uncharacterized protein n=1 Tax=Salegentibacter holothuriorum TaxID=241145 RepID=A0A1T5BPK5_9FLAO|nr:hypothetical protein [Salegentibacter holothuriorum]SKB48850.1 hypothetical protein SAMN05660776_1356 [Salegentibacter holothuriorum]